MIPGVSNLLYTVYDSSEMGGNQVRPPLNPSHGSRNPSLMEWTSVKHSPWVETLAVACTNRSHTLSSIQASLNRVLEERYIIYSHVTLHP